MKIKLPTIEVDDVAREAFAAQVGYSGKATREQMVAAFMACLHSEIESVVAEHTAEENGDDQ